MQYGITPKILNKKKHLINKHEKFVSIFELLDSLNQRMLTGHNAIEAVNGFIYNNPNIKEILYLVLERNLKIRVSKKLINKALPGFIPEFNVALANKYDEKTKKKIDFDKDTWFASRKLDGVRCLIIVDEKGKSKSFSRAGKQFNTLSLIEKEIESLGCRNVVFDGEICVIDENGNEDFQNVMKEISRKDHTIKTGVYQIFDYITYETFTKGVGKTIDFASRIRTLQSIIDISKYYSKYIDYVEHIPVTSFEEINKLKDVAAQKKWEGLMLRKNDLYKGKRSNDILKVKMFLDDEYIVNGISFGPFRYIKEGKEIEEDMLTAVNITHKGNKVKVGSGFSIEQRQHYYRDPSDIIGKEITVQYFEESQNQNGEFSLRFPVIKVIHEDKRDV
jgi:DNA ligase-1